MNILLSPASFGLSDYIPASEGLTAYGIINNMPKKVFFHAVTYQAFIRSPLKNAKIYELGSSRGSLLMEKSSTQNIVGLGFAAANYLFSSKILKREKIDAIHHMFPSTSGSSFDLLHLLPGPAKNYPFLFGPVFSPLASSTNGKSKLLSKLHAKTVKSCDVLAVSTSKLKESYSKIIDPDKIHVLPLGVDTEVFAPDYSKSKNDSLEILTIGWLTKRKGINFLIDAMPEILKHCKNVTLRILGEGTERDNLIFQAKKLDLVNHVLFKSFVRHSKLLGFYQRASIFCLPSLNEPFGKVIIEAMACGKPVVATKTEGPTEIISNGKDGFLVPQGSSKALAESLILLLSNDSMRRQMGRNARKKAEEKYSWAKVANEYYQLYKEAIERKNNPKRAND